MRLGKKKVGIAGGVLCLVLGVGTACNRGSIQSNDSDTMIEQQAENGEIYGQAEHIGLGNKIGEAGARNVAENVGLENRKEKTEGNGKGKEIQQTNEEKDDTGGMLRGKRKSKIQLTDEECELLTILEQALMEADYERAAQYMLEKEDCLWNLYYEKMNENRYLYQEEKMLDYLSGTGLVVKKANVIYYGELSEGVPNGIGTALQVVHMDSPRFDYSTGIWKDGKMQGDGIVGYYYYEGAKQENGSVRRSGRFENDLMEGEVIYRTVNTQGEAIEWVIDVEEGKIVVDENWIYDEEKKVYQLPSQQDQEHAYVIGESGIDKIWFQNLIPW